jgi:hypothetical protein
VIAGTAAAAPVVGVAEDATKYASDGGASLYTKMKGYGLSSNRISVFWDYTKPTTIPEKAYLDKVVPAAMAANVQLVFAIYADPRVSGAATAVSGGGTDAFCNYAVQIAKTYPSVTKIIIGNEPNQPRFWRPQFNADGSPVAGAAYETLLAAGYDFLKAADPSIRVIGLALSNHGNDDYKAKSNVSTSPVRFIQQVGSAYRASGRKRPLMDAVAMHPYPNLSTDSLTQGIPWPNVGVANLDRFKQAIWDAFHGTAQRTIEQGLPIRITEVGWQVGVPQPFSYAYTGRENVATTDEATQSTIYTQLLQLLACDPSVQDVLFFHLIDESPLEGYQSGLVRADWSTRPSFSAVHDLIAQTAGRCQGALVPWRHSTSVIGASARIGTLGRSVPVVVNADESVRVVAAIVRVPRRGSISPAAVAQRLANGNEPQVNNVRLLSSRAYWKTTVRVPLAGLLPGSYVVAVQVAAELAPGRTTIFLGPRFSTPVFRVIG